ncbi:uncharacterized protein LOC120104813 [Phoenix dactylifera]|uniref:Uncharacterized protein LOC120104813 n=1 Tax=Phoenix dactylifera TaxID=42345 RepID=A0A8B8ZEJ3_PHODC|nr:uncharacterized protein LOC120104813 [Phoenix dactylifera]
MEGENGLLVTVGLAPRESTVRMDFLVVRLPSAYSAILGRPRLNALRAMVSTYHLLVRFSTDQGVGEVRGDQRIAKRCYMATHKAKQPAKTEAPSHGEQTAEAPTETSNQALPIETLEVRDNTWKKRVEPGKLLTQIPLQENCPKLTVQVGSGLSSLERDRLIEFLRTNMDIFTWSPADMPEINPEVMVHRLQVKPTYKPVRQKKRGSAPERQRAAAEKVDKLLEAGFIREVFYPDWLANVVLVKKANEKWRMCVDYTDLNKACPKDSFFLPSID